MTKNYKQEGVGADVEFGNGGNRIQSNSGVVGNYANDGATLAQVQGANARIGEPDDLVNLRRGWIWLGVFWFGFSGDLPPESYLLTAGSVGDGATGYSVPEDRQISQLRFAAATAPDVNLVLAIEDVSGAVLATVTVSAGTTRVTLPLTGAPITITAANETLRIYNTNVDPAGDNGAGILVGLS